MASRVKSDGKATDAAAARRAPKAGTPKAKKGTWGGRRPGAGRKPGPGGPRVPHAARPPHDPKHPVLVTVRARPDLPSLRAPRPFERLRAAIAGAQKDNFRVLHFAVHADRLLLLLEADDRDALTAGVQGLKIRAARALNHVFGRTGGLWADRYEARPLDSARLVRDALVALLVTRPAAGSTDGPPARGVDEWTSAPWFDGWAVPVDGLRDAAEEDSPVVAPRTWLASVGWRRLGLLRPDA